MGRFAVLGYWEELEPSLRQTSSQFRTTSATESHSAQTVSSPTGSTPDGSKRSRGNVHMVMWEQRGQEAISVGSPRLDVHQDGVAHGFDPPSVSVGSGSPGNDSSQQR